MIDSAGAGFGLGFFEFSVSGVRELRVLGLAFRVQSIWFGEFNI